MTYPTIRPSLTLDFSKSKQLDPRITFSRSSTGTYVDGGVVKSAANNVARFEKDGLLIEESRTNYFQNSNSGATSKWNANSGVTISASANTAPDGSTNAIRIEATTSGQYAELSWVAPSTGAYTASIYIRSRTSADQSVRLDFSGASTTLQTVPASGEWVRLRDTQGSSVGSGGRYFYVQSPQDETLDVDVWGEQVELGSFATSFIPTSGNTVTRSADVAEMTADNFSSWYNNSEGTIFVDTKAASLTNTVVASLSTNANNRMEVRSAGSSLTTSRFEVVESSATQFSSTITNNNTYRSLALGYKSNNTNAAANGTLGTLDTAFSVPAVDNLYLGNNIFATTQRPGHISRLSYYNQRITDAQLQELTS